MTAKEIIKIGKFPLLVKLNKNFSSMIEKSFDSNEIVQILDIRIEVEGIVIIDVKVPEKFIPYNKIVTKPTWYDDFGHPSLTIYQCFPEKFKKGEFYDTIWAMVDDELFDIVDDDFIPDLVSVVQNSTTQVTQSLLEELCNKYPNDQELGAQIRKLVTKNNEE